MVEILVIACSCLATVFICHLVTSALSERAEKRYQQWNDQISFVYQQIKELYEPLMTLITECRQLEQALSGALDEVPEEIDAKAPVEALSMRGACSARDVSSCLECIFRLLLQKSHFLKEGKLPRNFQRLVTYQHAWKARRHRALEFGGPYGGRQNPPAWPWQFEQEITTTYRDLRYTHKALLLKLQQPEPDVCSILLPSLHIPLHVNLLRGRKIIR